MGCSKDLEMEKANLNSWNSLQTLRNVVRGFQADGSPSGSPLCVSRSDGVPLKVEVESVPWEGNSGAGSREEMWALLEQVANEESP